MTPEGITRRRRIHRRCLLVGVVACFAFAGHWARAELAWSELPPLPDEFGFGGPAVGVVNGVLVVAGGANFPTAPPWEGGQKVWHDRVFLLRDSDGQWQQVGHLPQRIAYAASITTKQGLLLIGGEVDGTAVATVYRLRLNGVADGIVVDELPSLPTPATYLSAGMIGSTVYVVAAGRSAGADRLDNKHFWSLDLETLDNDNEAAWKVLEPWPGPARHKSVVVIQAVGSGAQNLFLMSGSNPRFLSDGSPDLENFAHFTDGYRYDPDAGEWIRIADLPVLDDDREVPDKHRFAEQRWPVVAATGIDVGQSHLLVFSGSTGRYITLPLDECPRFSNKVLAYHTITDTWVEAGTMPTGVVTTSATRWNDKIVIPSGEVRPGVRTNKVQVLSIDSSPPAFGAVNYTVLAVYLLGMMIVGGFFSFRARSTNDFFRGGQRVPFWVAGLSIFATMLSSITFLALPAKAFATDWTYYVAQLTIIPIAMVVVTLAIPFFRHIDATSAYEYLEKRFHYLVRLFASLQFVMFQVGRMAIVMYLPALALAEITQLTVMQCVVLMGALSIVYCTMGGVEAVVWTDAIQTIVLMGGLLVAIFVVVASVEGGATTTARTAYEDGKLHLANLDFSWASYTTTAVWVIFIGQFFQNLFSYTSDQAIVQRYVTTKDERSARRAMWTTAWLSVFGSVLFFVMGSALYVFYQTHAVSLDVGMKNDSIFPLFIATQLPIGIAGLVVAGVFAAAQSTISTSMNSTATAIVTDFCMPLKVLTTDRGYLILARILTVLLGLIGTGTACLLVVLNETSMIDAFIKVIGLFGGAVCGLFMLGMLTRRANAVGGFIGAVVGFLTVWWVLIYTEVHFFLYAMVGTLTTFAAGYVVSAVSSPPRDEQLAGLTLYDRSVHRRQ